MRVMYSDSDGINVVEDVHTVYPINGPAGDLQLCFSTHTGNGFRVSCANRTQCDNWMRVLFNEGKLDLTGKLIIGGEYDD